MEERTEASERATRSRRASRGRRRGRGGRRERPGGIVSFLAALCLLVLLAGGGAGYLYVQKYMPTRARADLSEYFDVSGNNVQVYLNEEKQRTEKEYLVVGRYENGHVYLPYDYVFGKLNRRFYWAEDLSQFIYTLPEESIRVGEADSLPDGSAAFLKEGKELYLNVDWLTEYTDLWYEQYVEEEHKRIFLNNDRGQKTEASLLGKEAVRLLGGVKSEVLTELPKGAAVTVLETLGKWSRVRTADGYIGYLRNKKLGDFREKSPASEFSAPEFSYSKMGNDEKVMLGFHQITNAGANEGLEKAMQNAEGMNVIAPTWYVLSSDEGDFISYASPDYVAKAHAAGVQVWATVNNFDMGDVDETVFLPSAELRERLIQGLTEHAAANGIDGLNIDLELVPKSMGRHYVQFIRELSVACRKAGLILSVDCYVPYEYNRYYDLEELGVYCDYVIIMCYDEHYAGSETAGSVSSISYVNRGITEAKALMSAERIIIAVPFYTRVWIHKPDGSMSSDALGIRRAGEWILEKGVSLRWEDSVGQNYGMITEEDGTKKEIWMEDERSMQLKLGRIREADVAGVAAWKLLQEPEGFWENLQMNQAGRQSG